MKQNDNPTVKGDWMKGGAYPDEPMVPFAQFDKAMRLLEVVIPVLRAAQIEHAAWKRYIDCRCTETFLSAVDEYHTVNDIANAGVKELRG